MKRTIVLLAVLAGFGCSNRESTIGGEEADAGVHDPDAGCAVRCGGVCCGDGEVCEDGVCVKPCTPETEAQLCGNAARVCGPLTATDRCGVQREVASCGACAAQERCEEGECVCAPEQPDELCARLGRTCGEVTARDNCGVERTYGCGACAEQQRCEDGRCLCVPEAPVEFCQRLEVECGAWTADDNCGFERTYDCGPCGSGLSCEANACVCEHETEDALCARLAKQCGAVTAADTCGETKTYDCGGCGAGQRCEANACVCAPQPDAAFCQAKAVQCGGSSGADNCGLVRTVAECGPCAVTDVCSNGTCVFCQSETDEQFCARHFKNCGLLSGQDNCGRARTAECGTCTAPATCGAKNACALPDVPFNDQCGTPEVLVFDAAGTARAAVTTTGAGHDFSGSCSATSDRGDVTAVFTLTAARDVQVTVTPTDGKFRPIVYVQRACGDADTEIGCSRATTSIAATLALPNLAAGAYFVVVDTYASDSNAGEGTLVVTAAPPRAQAANDSCAGAQALSFDSVTHQVGVSASTLGATDDMVAGCAASYGGDLVYSFELTDVSAVKASVARTGASTKYNPTLYLRSACDDPTSELACGSTTSGLANVAAANLPAGVYYLVVDGTNSSNTDGTSVFSGSFALEVTVAPAMVHDVCAGAFPLLIDWTTGLASVSGDTAFATDDTTHGCAASSTGRDLVYSFEIPAGQSKNVVAELTPAQGSALRPVLALRQACADSATELACLKKTTFSTARVVATRLGAGTYYLWVDGSSANANGPFTLTLSAVDPPLPPAVDNCRSAQRLTIDPVTHLATATGSTMDALDDYQGSCAGAVLHSGPDVVYTFTTTTTQNVAINAYRDASTPSFRPAVYVRTTCLDALTEVPGACSNSSETTSNVAAGLGRLMLTNLPANTYFVIVDGQAGTAGNYQLDIIAYPSGTPSNDACASAASLDFDGQGRSRVTGSTCEATSTDTSYGCLGTGRDVIYTFETTTPKNLTLSLRAGHGGFHVLHMRRICEQTSGDRTEVACRNSNLPVDTLYAKQLPAGRYYVFVDAYSECGAFVLDTQLEDPLPGPAQDSCAGAPLLAFDQDGNAAISDSTSLGYDDGDGSCRAGTGMDLVYKFTLTDEKVVSLQVVPELNSTLKPVVYLRSTCDQPGTEIVCAFTSTAGATAVPAPTPRLAPGTYYVWVDSYERGSFGDFALLVHAEDAPTPAPLNDACAAAIPLQLVGGRAEVTDTTVAASDDARGSCAVASGPHSGPDVVYSLTLSTSTALTARVTRHASATGYKPALYVRRACVGLGASEDLVCGNGNSSGVAEITATYPAGTYYFFVDGVSTSSGAFTLELAESTPVTGESCLNPEPLAFVNDVASATFDTTTAANNSEGACSSSGTTITNDLVYSFTLAADKRVDVVAAASGSSSFHPALYLRRGSCADPAAEVMCVGGDSTTLSVSRSLNRLAPGTYYLWVDTYSTYKGAGTLTVTLSDPAPLPTNDVCARAQAISVDPATGRATITASTAGAFGDLRGSCASTDVALDGADLVYEVTVGQDAVIIAQLTRASASTSYRPALYLQSTCGGSADLACSTATATGSATSVSASGLAAGTYYLVVDGVNLSYGDFTLDVLVRPAVTNDDCGHAEPLAFTNGVATVVGDTRLGRSSTKGSCSSSTDGKDLVYTFTTAAVKNVQIDVTSGGVYKPWVYVRSTCEVAATEKFCGYKSSAVPLQVLSSKLPAGTYYLWVDTYDSTSAGVFAMTVRLDDPAPPPLQDVCAGAQRIPLTQGTNPSDPYVGSLTAQNLTDANNDYTGTCATESAPEDGGDFVYSVDVPVESILSVWVTPSASLKPAVYLRKVCEVAGPSNELACRQTTTAGTSLKIDAPGLAVQAGTYFIIVDAVSKSSGSFDLAVSAKPSALPGEACFSAAVLSPEPDPVDPTVETTGWLSGNSLDYNDDYRGSCSTSTHGDKVFVFTTQATRNVEVLAKGDPAVVTKYRPYIHMRRTCDLPSTEMGCTYNSSGTGVEARLWLANVPAGTYYVFIDGYSTASSYGGAWVAKLSLFAPLAAPSNDTCAAAEDLGVLPVPSPSTITRRVDLEAANNDYAGTCGSTTYPLNGADRVYAFTLTTGAIVTAEFQRDTTSSARLKEAIYLRRECGNAAAANEIRCAYNTSTTATASAKLTDVALPAGTYYLIVDAVQSSSGEGDLRVTTRVMPAGDDCSNAIEMTFNGDVATPPAGITYTTVGASDGGKGSCYTTSQTDLVFYFTLSAEKVIRAEVTPTGTMKPFMYLRRSCGDAATEVGCVYSSTTAVKTIDAGLLAPGTYYVWVDTYSSTASYQGPFSLRVTASDPPPVVNDACAGATALPLSESVLTMTGLQGETSYAHDSGVGTCATGTSRDVVYSLTTTNPHSLTVTATRDTSLGTISPVLYLRRSCDQQAATEEVTCVAAASTSATLAVSNLPAGTWYLWVDGAANSSGKFKLDGTLGAPVVGAPANESCFNPASITFAGTSAMITGSTAHSHSEAAGSCGGAGFGDVVYAFNLAQAQGVQVIVSPSATSTLVPVVYVRHAACASSALVDERVCVAAAETDPTRTAMAEMKYAPAGTYFLWVDGKDGNTGDFELDVVLLPPVAPPVNDTCSGVLPVTLGTPVSGDTTLAIDDYGYAMAPCGAGETLLGPEVVYSFTAPADGTVSATLTPAANWDAALWVTAGGCAGGGELCVAGHDGTGGDGEIESVTFNVVAGTVYYIVVDGFLRSDAGTFTLLVQ